MIKAKARISEAAMVDLAHDIDAAILDRDLVRLAAFAAEAEKTFGMDQAAGRAREILALLETKAAKADRDELMRIKAALQPRPPSTADLVAQYDMEQLAPAMRHQPPFSVNDSGRSEREAAEQTRLLREKNRRAEEQRAAQVTHDQPETPWWRR